MPCFNIKIILFLGIVSLIIKIRWPRDCLRLVRHHLYFRVLILSYTPPIHNLWCQQDTFILLPWQLIMAENATAPASRKTHLSG